MPRAFTVNDQPPSRRKVWWVLGCMASVILVSCAGVIGWLVAVLIGLSPFGGSESSLANRWPAAQERQQTLRDVFDGQRQPLNDPDLGQIRRLLDQIAAAGSAEDNQAFAELVDFDGLYERFRSYPGMPRFNWLERQIMLRHIRDDSDGPGNVATFDIVHIERVSDDEAVVYVFAKNEDTDGDPFEFMISRSDGEYRLIDWTRIETGWSEAQQLARMQVVSEDSRINSYENGSSEMLAADDLMEEGDYDAAAERLRKAGQYAVPSGISDLWFYMLALRWSEIGEAEECVETCRRAANPGEMPGFYSLEAIWLNHLEEYPEALTAVESYERVAGFQPGLMRTKAEILEALDRHDDALLCWQRLAEFAPHQVSSLVAYSQALPEPRRGEVLKLVQQAAEPVTVASELAGLLLYHDDEATVALLQQFVNDQAPDSVESHYLQARVFAYQGEDERAAQSYRRAAELGSDAEGQVDYWYCFLDAMVDAGRVVEGYLAMPEATDAFRQLVEGIEWDEAMIGYDDLDELVQAHRERAPDDPWLSFIDGLLAAKDNDLEKADAEFQQAEQSGDEDLVYPAGSQRRDVLSRQGRLLEAYRIYADEQGEDVFQELAAKCENGDDLEGLLELIEVHRKQNPDDPWVSYYTAVLQRKDDQPEAALAILETIAEAEDGSLAHRVRWMRIQLEVELGRWHEVYENSDEPEEDFSRLVTALRTQADWGDAEKLCQLQRERFPDNPSGLIQSIELATKREDYAAVVRLLTPWPEELEVSEYQANNLRSQLFESLLALEQTDEALTRAREFADTEDDYGLLMIVLDRERRWAEFGELLDDPDRAEEFKENLQYADFTDYYAFRTDPAAADLRQRVPPPVPTPRTNSRVVLMGTFHSELTADRLQEAAGHEEGIEVRPLPTTKSCVDALFEVRTPQAVVLVSAGSEGYCDPQFLKELRLKGSEIRQVLENHRGWLQVQGIEAAGKASPVAVRRLVGRLAAGLYDPGVQAIYMWETGAPTSHVALADDTTASKLGSSESFHTLYRDAPELYLAPCFEKDAFAQEDWDYARQSELRKFAKSATTDSDQHPHLACLSLRLGPASEQIWVRIRSAEHTGYGQFDLQGQLTSDSVLWPHLKQGESIRFYSYQVLDWKVE